MSEPEPQMSEPKRRMVPFSDPEATARARERLFETGPLQALIGSFMDMRSHVKLASTNKLALEAGMQGPHNERDTLKAQIRKNPGHRQELIAQPTNRVFKDTLLQDYIGTFLSSKDRMAMRNAGKVTRLGGTKPWTYNKKPNYIDSEKHLYVGPGGTPGAVGTAHWGTGLEPHQRAALRAQYRNPRTPGQQRQARQKTFKSIIAETSRSYMRRFPERMLRRRKAPVEGTDSWHGIPEPLTRRHHSTYYYDRS